jgi:hypothetical protein
MAEQQTSEPYSGPDRRYGAKVGTNAERLGMLSRCAAEGPDNFTGRETDHPDMVAAARDIISQGVRSMRLTNDKLVFEASPAEPRPQEAIDFDQIRERIIADATDTVDEIDQLREALYEKNTPLQLAALGKITLNGYVPKFLAARNGKVLIYADFEDADRPVYTFEEAKAFAAGMGCKMMTRQQFIDNRTRAGANSVSCWLDGNTASDSEGMSFDCNEKTLISRDKNEKLPLVAILEIPITDTSIQVEDLATQETS